MRRFTLDTMFPRGNVLKTPFRNDVARVYLRTDDLIVVQCGGTFRPISISGDAPLDAVLALASDILDKWDTPKPTTKSIITKFLKLWK